MNLIYIQRPVSTHSKLNLELTMFMLNIHANETAFVLNINATECDSLFKLGLHNELKLNSNLNNYYHF